MGYQQERDEFIGKFTELLVTGSQTPEPHTGYRAAQIARKLLRHASTLQRLAVAQCNGDFPADNGERKTVQCSRCESGWHISAMRYDRTAETTATDRRPMVCVDCRTQELVTAILSPLNLKPSFAGDPRGAVFVIHRQDTPQELISNGRERGLYVPARER